MYGVFVAQPDRGFSFRDTALYFRAFEDAGLLDLMLVAEIPRVDLRRFDGGVMRRVRHIVGEMGVKGPYLLVVADVHKQEDMRVSLESWGRPELEYQFFE